MGEQPELGTPERLALQASARPASSAGWAAPLRPEPGARLRDARVPASAPRALPPASRVPDSVSRVPPPASRTEMDLRSEEHTSELQSLRHLVCRLLLEKKKSHL